MEWGGQHRRVWGRCPRAARTLKYRVGNRHLRQAGRPRSLKAGSRRIPDRSGHEDDRGRRPHRSRARLGVHDQRLRAGAQSGQRPDRDLPRFDPPSDVFVGRAPGGGVVGQIDLGGPAVGQLGPPGPKETEWSNPEGPVRPDRARYCCRERGEENPAGVPHIGVARLHVQPSATLRGRRFPPDYPRRLGPETRSSAASRLGSCVGGAFDSSDSRGRGRGLHFGCGGGITAASERTLLRDTTPTSGAWPSFKRAFKARASFQGSAATIDGHAEDYPGCLGASTGDPASVAFEAWRTAHARFRREVERRGDEDRAREYR